MIRKKRGTIDLLEGAIEQALQPGMYISDHDCFSFVNELNQVAYKIGKLTTTDPSRAVVLFETFIMGCYEKAEDIDDSSGSFGEYVNKLFCEWTKARQKTKADPEKTAFRLLAWMEDDPYGLCYHLDKDLVTVFDKAGLSAFERQVRTRFDGAAVTESPCVGSQGDQNKYNRKRWGDVLRTLYFKQKDVAAYVSLAEETGLTAQDCHDVATLLITCCKPEEALTWVERGIDLDKKCIKGSLAYHNLAKLKRDLLIRLGRDDEALEDAWADYQKHPGKNAYDDLMRLAPKTERAKWHERAIEAAHGINIHSLIELLIKTKEWGRLAELVRQSKDADLEGVSHFVTEPAAKKLEKAYPDIAGKPMACAGDAYSKCEEEQIL
jgi:hypothetical protein